MTDDAGDGETCDACGDSLSGADARRVRTWVEDDTVVYRQFCDDACRRRWEG